MAPTSFRSHRLRSRHYISSATASQSNNFDTFDAVHIHVSPLTRSRRTALSAGVAMFNALMSLFTNRTVADNVAMTGEVSLSGLVLPVGGIK